MKYLSAGCPFWYTSFTAEDWKLQKGSTDSRSFTYATYVRHGEIHCLHSSFLQTSQCLTHNWSPLHSWTPLQSWDWSSVARNSPHSKNWTSHIYGEIFTIQRELCFSDWLKLQEIGKEVGKSLEQKQKEIIEPTETFKFAYWPLGIFSVGFLRIGFICQSIGV